MELGHGPPTINPIFDPTAFDYWSSFTVPDFPAFATRVSSSPLATWTAPTGVDANVRAVRGGPVIGDSSLPYLGFEHFPQHPCDDLDALLADLGRKRLSEWPLVEPGSAECGEYLGGRDDSGLPQGLRRG